MAVAKPPSKKSFTTMLGDSGLPSVSIAVSVTAYWCQGKCHARPDVAQRISLRAETKMSPLKYRYVCGEP